MNKRKIILLALGLAAASGCALYANSINDQALYTSILTYKKEVLKSKREKITEEIKTIDAWLGIWADGSK